MKPPKTGRGKGGGRKDAGSGAPVRPGAPVRQRRTSYSQRLIASSVASAREEQNEPRSGRGDTSRGDSGRADRQPTVGATDRAGRRPPRVKRGPQLVDATEKKAIEARRGKGRTLDGFRPSGRMRPQPKPKAGPDPRPRRPDHDPARTEPRSVAKPARPGGRVEAGPPARPAEPVRIAKALARAGLCSRREAERWITDGRVSVNGRVLDSPAVDVAPRDIVKVDGQPLPPPEPARLWRYHKPKGLVTTHADPEGRPTVFDSLPAGLPRVISIGRLDYNSEGLLLLTNDGELARHLELPATGWLRRYRVRAYGRLTQTDLDPLKNGITIDGVAYGPIEATLDSVQSGNMWLTMGLREGKNREVRRILGHLGLEVNRLIRISFGPFQLLDLAAGDAEHVRRRVLADQLGPDLAREFGLDAAADEDDGRRSPFAVRREPEGQRRNAVPSDGRPSGSRPVGGGSTGARPTGRAPLRSRPFKGRPK